MKQMLRNLGLLAGLFIFLAGCGNGRSLPNNSVNQASEQANGLATQVATTIPVQGEALATQASDIIANEGEALATQASDIIAEGAATVAAAGEQIVEDGAIATVVPGSLAEKFANSTIPTGNGTVKITVAEAELNQAIAAGQSAQAQAGTPSLLQNPQVAFSNGLIILTGTITEPVNGLLTVSFSPYVVNGTLQFEVVEASVGNLRVPPLVLQTAEQTLNSTLGTAMTHLPPGTGLQSVTVSGGTMTIVVVRA